MARWKGIARQVLILCCFVSWLGVVVHSFTVNLSMSLWLGVTSGVMMMTGATCLLGYSLALRPKGMRCLGAAVVPIYVAANVVDWAYAGGLPADKPFYPEVQLAAIVVGAVSLYFLLRYGYSATLPPRAFSPRALIAAFLASGLIAFMRFVPVFAPGIRVEHDYLAEYNALVRPAVYNPNENAAIDYARWASRLPPMPEDVNRVRALWPEDMSDADRRAVEAWTTSEAALVPALVAASRKSLYWIERDAPDGYLADVGLSELRDLRRLAYCLTLHAKLAAVQGETGPALDEILAVYGMGTQLIGPRSMVEQLVGMALCNLGLKSAFQLLSRREVGPASLRGFQENLGHLASRWEHGFDCRAERLMTLDDMQRVFSDDGTGGGCISRRRSFRMGWGWVRIDRADTVKTIDDFIASISTANQETPWRNHESGHCTWGTEEQRSNPVIAGFSPYWTESVTLCWRLRVSSDALAATIAILRYRAAEGRLPVSLDELVSAGYLDVVPIDPFGDGSLRYHRRDRDFVLYSCGLDFDDDGGTASKWGKGDDGGDEVFWPAGLPEK